MQEELIRAGVLPEDYDFEAHKKLVPMQPGDVPVTYADTSALERDFGYKRKYKAVRYRVVFCCVTCDVL